MRKLTMEEWREEYEKIYDIIFELKEYENTGKIIKKLDNILDEMEELEIEREEE